MSILQKVKEILVYVRQLDFGIRKTIRYVTS